MTSTFCPRCGQELVATASHPDCDEALHLEPPRYCAKCRRRLVVQVTPTGWTASCSVDGTCTANAAS